jgi:hypothetical protein
MPKTTYHWLIIGALVGFILVLIVCAVGLPMPGWAAALVTTLFATVFGGGGPVKATVEQFAPVTTASA